MRVRVGEGEWERDHLQAYLRSKGVVGHVLDLTSYEGYPFGTHCLIRHRGRKSGKTFINPLTYGAIGGEVVICASRGGSDQAPQWYSNIAASDTVEFQIATEAFRGTWREPRGAEREKVWAFMVDCYPFYGLYQTRTARQIQLVMMKSCERIPVFRESDISEMRAISGDGDLGA